MATDNPELPNDATPEDSNEEESFPELDAILNILERARHLAAKNQTEIQLSFRINLTGLTNNQVKEKYIFSGSPSEKKHLPNSPEYKKLTAELKRIVTQEMENAFPGHVQDLNNTELDQLNEELNKDNSIQKPQPKPDNKPNNPNNDNQGPFMQLRKFQDI